MGGERSEAREALRPAHLQPEVGGPSRDADPVAPSVPGSTGDPLRALLNDPELTVDERAGLVEALERAARHLVDAGLFAQCVKEGFTGLASDVLTADLVAYALPVMLAWLRRGRIFAECAAKGRPLRCGDRDRERLAGSRDDRLELAGETIAQALKLFRDLAVAGRGWSPAGGAALTTYFVGTCVQVYPNVWRDWLKEQSAELPVDDPGMLTGTTGHHLDTHTDPAEIAASHDLVRAALDAMPDSVRDVAEPLILHGWTLPEVAAHLGTTAGAVEQRLRRYRRQQAKDPEQAITNDPPASGTTTRSGDT